MEAWILNQNMESVAIIDAFDSFIWTDKYGEYGDFELYLPTDTELLKLCAKDNYVWFKGSDRMMIINEQEINSEAVGGSKMAIRGYSLESILSRRVVWSKTRVSGNVQDVCKRLINNNFINPSASERKISNLIFDDTNDSAVLSTTVDMELLGDNIYTVIKDLCADNDLGFKIVPDLEAKKFRFKLYSGVDRTYAQEVRPYVLFSPAYENLISSDYKSHNKDTSNVARVYGILKEPKDPPVFKTTKTTTGSTTVGADKVKRRKETITTKEYAENGKLLQTTVEVKDIYEPEDGLNNWYLTTTKVTNGDGEVVKESRNETSNHDTKKETKNAQGEVTRTDGTNSKTVTESDTDENGTEGKTTTTTVTYSKDGNGDIISETETVTVDDWTSTKKTQRLSSAAYRLDQTVGTTKGLLRRELFVDAQDVTLEDEQGNELTDAQYKSRLTNKGTIELKKEAAASTYEGETDPNVMYTYKVDYDLGDVVQIANEYGVQGTSRISAIVFSQSTDKTTVLPTFTAV